MSGFHDICPECMKVRAHTRSDPPYKCPRCKRIEELVDERDELRLELRLTREGNPTFSDLRLQIEVLEEREAILIALEGAGVDNWEGYEIAMESLE